MMGANSVFIDTNILVYASIPESPFHLIALNAVQSLEQAGRAVWISRQVLREYLTTLTRPQAFGEPIPVELVIEEVRQFENRFQVAEDTSRVTARLLALLAEVAVGGRQVHDANIVATMQVYGVNELLTHNTADFDRFSSVITVLPLVSNPD